MKTYTLDFETKPITQRPDYPPEPVGLAVRWPSGKYEYLAWGHPNGNNCNRVKAERVLTDIWNDHKSKVLFHNSAFDIEVACKEFGLPWLPDDRIHDTLVLAFLHNPRAASLSLKPLAEELLGEAPNEQDAIKDWIGRNLRYKSGTGQLVRVSTDTKPKGTVQIPERMKAAYIGSAPVSVVAPYAIGDVRRTWKLFKWFNKNNDHIPLKTYREVEIPILRIKTKMEQNGARLHTGRLERMQQCFSLLATETNEKINRKLGLPNHHGYNLGSSEQLADCLDRARMVDEWVRTPTGKRSTKIDNLRTCVKDPKLVRYLEYKSVLEHYLNGFINPWLKRGGERLHTNFNTVRGSGDGLHGNKGTRTGRFSSSNPNLENIAANPQESTNRDVLVSLQELFKKKYNYNWRGLRDVFIAEKGETLLLRDYSQQELRVLANYDPTGELQKRYKKNPYLNFHDATNTELERRGISIPHKTVKIVVFQSLYGAFPYSLGQYLGIPKEKAALIQEQIFATMPGVHDLNNKLKAKGKLKTWGGRYYETEPPKLINGRMRSFDYKLLNILIQGSSADITKRAMVNVDQNLPSGEFHMQLQEHDELIAGCSGNLERNMVKFQEAMEDIDISIPMLTDGKQGKSWARAK